MGRISAILDEYVDYGFEGGGKYNTNVADMENGFTDKDSEWKWPRHEFSASFKDIDDDVREHLIAVFHVCRGRRHSIMFKDWNDYTIINQPLQVDPGTDNTIQLYKAYAPFGPPYVTIRPIQALNLSADAEYVAQVTDENGDPVAGTFNALTGEFTPVGLWGAGDYFLTCEFYVWVSFEDDYNPMTINSWRAHTANVSLVEERFDFVATNLPESWEE